MPYRVGNRIFGDDELSDAKKYADEINGILSYISESEARRLSELNEAFSGWDEFIKDQLKYIEDQASDDIDRVFLMEELQQLEDLFSQYEAGQITAEEFLEFEPNFILDAPGATEYWESLREGIDDPESQPEPGDLEAEESIFQILYDTIIGEQGVPEGVSPEVLSAIAGDFPNATVVDLEVLAKEIEEAGGWDEWYAQQQETDLEGPPEELPTELEEEEIIDINADTTLEDEIGVEPDMPIDIPFPTLPPREGDGNGEGNGDGDGEGVEATEETTVEEDVEEGEVDLTRPGGVVSDDYQLEDRPFMPSISVSSFGDGNGGDSGVGTTPRQGMFDPRFTPYMSSIGYTPVAVPQLIGPVKKDYDIELDGLFGRLLG
jgi:hypothetical protein